MTRLLFFQHFISQSNWILYVRNSCNRKQLISVIIEASHSTVWSIVRFDPKPAFVNGSFSRREIALTTAWIELEESSAASHALNINAL